MRGLSRPTSVLQNFIQIGEIWQYEGQNQYWSKNRERQA